MSTEHSLTQVTHGSKTPWADRTEKMTKFPQVMLHIDPASKTAQFQYVISFLAAVPTSTHVYAGGPKTKPSVVLYLRLSSLWTEYIFHPQWKMPDTKDSDALPAAHMLLPTAYFILCRPM